MTVKEIAERCGFAVACGGDGLERAVTGVFCCDLLSWAMGRAPADSGATHRAALVRRGPRRPHGAGRGRGVTALHWIGVVIAVIAFLLIGVFHPIVIKAEYYFGKRVWPVFLLAGLIFLAASLWVAHPVGSSAAGGMAGLLFAVVSAPQYSIGDLKKIADFVNGLSFLFRRTHARPAPPKGPLRAGCGAAPRCPTGSAHPNCAG